MSVPMPEDDVCGDCGFRHTHDFCMIHDRRAAADEREDT